MSASSVRPPESQRGVAGLVLAAGLSSRMGRNKLLLEVARETLIRRVVRTVIEAGLDPVLVVVGHERELVESALQGLPCRFVANSDYREGLRTSLQTGLRHVASEAPEATAAVVVLGDMPFVDREMIEAILLRYRERHAPIVASRYGPVTAPPILYDGSLFPELLALEGKFCAKRVVRQHEAEAVMIDWPEARLRDVDVPEDYELVTGSL